MQHLYDTHGPAVEPVFLVIRGDQYGSSDCTFDKFHKFPTTIGWTLNDKYKLELHKSVSDPSFAESGLHELGPFLQAWLWFGLIYTVVQDDKGPLLRYDELVKARGKQVTTEKLNGQLQRWRESVHKQAETHPDLARIRIIRIELVLQVARRVILKNCGKETLVDDILALSLMVLGETLTSTKASIMETEDLDIPGWHGEDADEGWGPSRAVHEKMEKEGWCPRTLHILRGQLKGHATLMYCAYLAYRESGQMAEHNTKRCTKDECKVKSELMGTNEYKTKHLSRPPHNHHECNMQGPDMAKIVDILANSEETGEIPLLTLTMPEGESGAIEIRVKNCNPKDRNAPIYATISHVWADGWGNEKLNKLNVCQLRFIFTMLQNATKLSSRLDDHGNLLKTTIPFWMDTLVIPVKSDDVTTGIRLHQRLSRENPQEVLSRLKKEAISQIHSVFTASEFTIVIDNDLSAMYANDDRPCESAMRILASGWMKRLWTLQEAFLSQRLYVAFGDHGGTHQPVEDFDILIDESLKGDNGVVSSTRRHLSESLMNADRSHRINQQRDPMAIQQPMDRLLTGYSLIANAWKAARWRTTINPAHETLALATLLNLQYQGTSIAEAGLRKPQKNSKPSDLDDLVCDFWTLFDRSYPGSIPAGLIFLPGSKVQKRGYGWAPRTFLSVFETDHPDPLAPVKKSGYTGTFIDNKWGLHVQYPGFILHCQHGSIRNSILLTDPLQSFVFPGSGSLLEWYEVSAADDKPSTDETQSILDRRTQLAIILTRPDPKEMPHEIGLLVEIYDKTTPGIPQVQQAAHHLAPVASSQNTSQISAHQSPSRPDTRRVAYCCQIIRRVRIKRDASKTLWNASKENADGNGGPPLLELMPRMLRPGGQEKPSDELCIGQALDTDQEWYVDGFQREREEHIEPARKALKVPKSSAAAKFFRGLMSLGGSSKEVARPEPLPPPVTTDPPPDHGTGDQMPSIQRKQTFSSIVSDALLFGTPDPNLRPPRVNTNNVRPHP